MKTPPNLMLALDPGLATGYSFFREGKPAELGDVRGMAEFDDWLIGLIDKYGKPDVIVVEDFRLWSWKAQKQAKHQSSSKMPASKVIGKLELWARMHKIPVVMQKPADKDMGVKWSGVKIPTNHDQSHHIVAFNHGIFYLVMNQMMAPLGMD